MIEIDDCPRCGSVVIARLERDQFRCFNCEFLWDERALPEPADGEEPDVSVMERGS